MNVADKIASLISYGRIEHAVKFVKPAYEKNLITQEQYNLFKKIFEDQGLSVDA